MRDQVVSQTNEKPKSRLLAWKLTWITIRLWQVSNWLKSSRSASRSNSIVDFSLTSAATPSVSTPKKGTYSAQSTQQSFPLGYLSYCFKVWGRFFVLLNFWGGIWTGILLLWVPSTSRNFFFFRSLILKQRPRVLDLGVLVMPMNLIFFLPLS